ncbi:MAG: mycothiol synthase [Dermatophilaceae bacterium]
MARIDDVAEVDAALVTRVDDIRATARRVDGVEPLSEAFVLAIGPGRDAGGTPGRNADEQRRDAVVHLVARDDGGVVVGYGQVAGRDGDGPASAELVMHPDHRRRGHGRALLDALAAEGAAAVWAHGDLEEARALAASAGWRMTRSLHLMARPLGPADEVDPELPAGFTVRPFEPGRDDVGWVRLNAAAFAGHPEQGRMTLADLRERMAQPWFDPAGLLIVDHEDADAPVAFHWTKIERTPPLDAADASGRAHDPEVREASHRIGRAPDLGTDEVSRRIGRAPDLGTDEVGGEIGEVYVVGVDPAWQGRGLGGPLTRLGLAHLARAGCTEAHLYVDGDNTAARRTYARLGFAEVSVDGQYTRARS